MQILVQIIHKCIISMPSHWWIVFFWQLLRIQSTDRTWSVVARACMYRYLIHLNISIKKPVLFLTHYHLQLDTKILFLLFMWSFFLIAISGMLRCKKVKKKCSLMIIHKRKKNEAVVITFLIRHALHSL